MLVLSLILTILFIYTIIKKCNKSKTYLSYSNEGKKDNNVSTNYCDDDEDDEPKAIEVGVWKKILKLVFAKKKYIIIVFVSIFMVAFLDVITPFINSKVIDVFFSENPDFSKKWLYLSFYVLIGIGYIIFIFLFIYYAGCVEVQVAYEIRKETFEKLQELPFSYFDRTPSGWIMARVTSDSRKLSDIISWGMVDFLWGIFTMSGALIMVYSVNYKLAIILTIVVPLMYLIGRYFTRKILKEYRKVRQTNSLITAKYNESVLGAKSTKTLTLEDQRYDIR